MMLYDAFVFYSNDEQTIVKTFQNIFLTFFNVIFDISLKLCADISQIC